MTRPRIGSCARCGTPSPDPRRASSRGPRRLIDLGISSGRDGKISLDASRINEILDEDREGVLNLLASVATSSVPELEVGSKSGVAAGTYGVSITTPPERASVVASGALTTLTADETLSFSISANHNEDAPSTTDFTVSLSSGSTSAQTIDEINSAFATQGVAFEAGLDDSGQLRFRGHRVRRRPSDQRPLRPGSRGRQHPDRHHGSGRRRTGRGGLHLGPADQWPGRHLDRHRRSGRLCPPLYRQRHGQRRRREREPGGSALCCRTPCPAS